MKEKKTIRNYFMLHILFFLYSFGGVYAKAASTQPMFSVKWCMLYGMVLLNLVIYAFFWQKILKKLPLVNAYASKAVTVVWGIIWGRLFFEERITVEKIIGSIILSIGVYFVVSEENT